MLHRILKNKKQIEETGKEEKEDERGRKKSWEGKVKGREERGRKGREGRGQEKRWKKEV